MSFWQHWLTRPQSTWVRKVIFQIHLRAGLLLGLYISVVCASGSAIVFRNDIYDVLTARTHVTPQGQTLSRDGLEQALQRTYPGYAIRDVTAGRGRYEASEVLLTRGHDEIRRIVNPYTGEDRGPSVAKWYRIFGWMSDLHGNLLLGFRGIIANAIGGALTAFLCLTGMVVWWPGVANWRRSLGVHSGVGWRRMIWELHGVVGSWSFAILFMWGTTGAYFVFPQPFRAAIEVFTPIIAPESVPPRAPQASPGRTLSGRPRPVTTGRKILQDFSLAHYGNFAGWPVKALWVLLGLVPLVLWASALVMWWNRIVSPLLRRMRSGAAENRQVLGRL